MRLDSLSKNCSVHYLICDKKDSTVRVEYLALSEIACDIQIQPRVAINLHHVKHLEEQLEQGKQLDPVTVFYDGEFYWLADGYHRFHAHRNCEQEVIGCIVYAGSKRDAVLYSVGANADHKPILPRSRADIQKSVRCLLEDSEWFNWSNYQIAKACKVSEKTVRNIRSSLTTEVRSENSCENLTPKVRSENMIRTYKTKHGSIASMKTENIGKKKDHKAYQELDNCSSKIEQYSRCHADVAFVEIEDETSRDNQKLTIAHHLQLTEGGLVCIHFPDNNKINGRLARIAAVQSSTVDVWVRDVTTMSIHRHTLKHQQVESVPMEREPQLVDVCLRIAELRKYNLDPFEVQILLLLEQPVAFTPVEMGYLAHIEQRYGIARTPVDLVGKF